MKRKSIWFAFIILAILNLLVFVGRRNFEFKPFVAYPELYGYCDTGCRQQWGRYLGDYPDHDKQLAGKILDSVLKDEPGTAGKIRRISDLLLGQFSDQKGVPGNYLQSLDPVDQYTALQQDTSQKIWCGNWSNMFAFFSSCAGITTRIIEIMKPGDHHVMNECYLPEDSTWALVDLTNGIVLPKNAGGRYFTLVDWIRKFENPGGADSSLAAYYNSSYQLYYYYRYKLAEVYSFSARAKRYLYPDPWYAIVDLRQKTRPGNFRFYLKISLFYLWMAVGIIAFIRELFKRRFPSRQNA
jgi:hypothetical protein